MKKIALFCLFFNIFCCSCSYVISVEKMNFPVRKEPGKCYVSSQIKLSQKGFFVLKSVDNQYITVRDSIRIDSVKMGADSIIRLQNKAVSLRYITSKTVAKHCVDDGKDFSDYFSVCIVETPAEYLGITKMKLDSLEKANQKYFYFEKMVLTDTSYIEKQFFSSKPIFSKGRIFHKNGNWSPLKEPNCPSCGDMRTTVRQIETMLNILGYNTNEDNVLSRAERKQLHDFQRKNGLKVGKINDETDNKLRALIRSKQ
jgi:hypothetical protein